jgi:hypothetical protein
MVIFCGREILFDDACPEEDTPFSIMLLLCSKINKLVSDSDLVD